MAIRQWIRFFYFEIQSMEVHGTIKLAVGLVCFVYLHPKYYLLYQCKLQLQSVQKSQISVDISSSSAQETGFRNLIHKSIGDDFRSPPSRLGDDFSTLLIRQRILRGAVKTASVVGNNCMAKYLPSWTPRICNILVHALANNGREESVGITCICRPMQQHLKFSWKWP